MDIFKNLEETAKELLARARSLTDDRWILAVYFSPTSKKFEVGQFAAYSELPRYTIYTTHPVDLKDYYAGWDEEAATEDIVDTLYSNYKEIEEKLEEEGLI